MEIEKKLDYKKPLLVDNRHFRKINPNINEYIDSVEKGLNDLPKKYGVVVFRGFFNGDKVFKNFYDDIKTLAIG